MVDARVVISGVMAASAAITEMPNELTRDIDISEPVGELVWVVRRGLYMGGGGRGGVTFEIGRGRGWVTSGC